MVTKFLSRNVVDRKEYSKMCNQMASILQNQHLLTNHAATTHSKANFFQWNRLPPACSNAFQAAEQAVRPFLVQDSAKRVPHTGIDFKIYMLERWN